jgi:hypothetical protein
VKTATPRARLLVVGGIVLGLAVLSLHWTREPHYDAWAWLDWGRQLVTAPAHLATAGGPSWKPLPVLVSGLAAPFGSLAPAIWLVVARAGGLAALALAYVLVARDAGRLAGVAAAAALAASQTWWLALGWGASEPLMVALLLAAVLALRAERHGWVQVALVAASLCRIEAWPFLVVHGVWAAHRRALPRWVPVAVNVAVAALWFGPDWYSTGNPFNQSKEARHSQEALATPHDLRGATATVARRAWRMLPAPVWVFAAFGLVWAWRTRRRWVLGLWACALGWDVIVVVLTVRGFAGLGRFTLPAAAVGCVLAGLGLGGLLALPPARRLAPAAAAVTAALAVPAWLVVVTAGAEDAVDRGGASSVAGLSLGVSRLRAAGVRGDYATRVNGPLGTALAWDLRAPIGSINRPDPRARRWVDFVIGRGPFAGPPRRLPGGAVCRTLRAGGRNRVVLVARTRRDCRRWLAT